jgi:hypothetical protein
MNEDTEDPVGDIKIWQQNTNRSLLAQLDLLNNTDPVSIDIVAIQEPHIDFRKVTQANSQWYIAKPTRFYTDGPEGTRSMLDYETQTLLVSHDLSHDLCHMT